jgi:hypothetical protein
MAKVIKLNSLSDQYLKEVNSAIRQLKKFEGTLFSTMLNLAVSGPWREWDESISEGEIAEFHPSMFNDIDDPQIQQLKRLYDEV